MMYWIYSASIYSKLFAVAFKSSFTWAVWQCLITSLKSLFIYIQFKKLVASAWAAPTEQTSVNLVAERKTSSGKRQGNTLLWSYEKYSLPPLAFFLKPLDAGQNDLCCETFFLRLAWQAIKHVVGRGDKEGSELCLCCQHIQPWISYCSPLSNPYSGNNARGFKRLSMLFCYVKRKKEKLHV